RREASCASGQPCGDEAATIPVAPLQITSHFCTIARRASHTRAHAHGQAAGGGSLVARYFLPATNLPPAKLMQSRCAPTARRTVTGSGLTASVCPSPVPLPIAFATFPGLTTTDLIGPAGSLKRKPFPFPIGFHRDAGSG